MQKVILFLISTCLLWSLVYSMHKSCSHDEDHADVIKNLPRQTTNLQFKSNPFPTSGKRNFGDGFEGIRIHFDESILEGDVDADKVTGIRNILKKVGDKFKELLKVAPVDGNLTLERFCNQYVIVDGEYRCTQYHSIPTCHSQSVPESMMREQPIYSTSPPYNQIDTTQSGPGVADSDIVIFAMAKNSGSCATSDSTLAFAGACVQEFSTDRPVAGFINFCPGKIDLSTESKRNDFYWVSIHEAMHVLGISKSLFTYFRDKDGKALTKRRRSNDGDYVHDVGVPPSEPNSENTLASFTQRGKSVNMLILDETKAQARNHFDCPTLQGYEIEDQGSAGTVGSHPEMRISFTDVMNGAIPTTPVISKMTLSIFAASGWYTVDYSKADHLSWGYQRGCSFVQDKCLKTPGPTSDFPNHFCTGMEPKGDGQSGQRCSQNLLGHGTCDIKTYTADIPSHFRYFSDPRKGGAELMDFCPTWNVFLYNIGDGELSLCSNPGIKSNDYQLRGESFEASSRCVMSKLASSGTAKNEEPGCYPMDCSDNGVIVKVGDTNVECTEADEGNQKTVSGFSGYFVCPKVVDVCPPEHSSPTCDPPCGNNAFCNSSGKCECLNNFSGPNCDISAAATLKGMHIWIFIVSMVIMLF